MGAFKCLSVAVATWLTYSVAQQDAEPGAQAWTSMNRRTAACDGSSTVISGVGGSLVRRSGLGPTTVTVDAAEATCQSQVLAVTLAGLIHPCDTDLTVTLSRGDASITLLGPSSGSTATDSSGPAGTTAGAGSACVRLEGDYAFMDGGGSGFSIRQLASAYAPNSLLPPQPASAVGWPAAASSLRGTFSKAAFDHDATVPWVLTVIDATGAVNSRLCGWSLLLGTASSPDPASLVGMRSSWSRPAGPVPAKDSVTWGVTISQTDGTAPPCPLTSIVLQHLWHPSAADVEVKLRHSRADAPSDVVEVVLIPTGALAVDEGGTFMQLGGWYLLTSTGASVCTSTSCMSNTSLPSGVYSPPGHAAALKVFATRGSAGTWELVMTDAGGTAGTSRGELGCFQLQFGTAAYSYFPCPMKASSPSGSGGEHDRPSPAPSPSSTPAAPSNTTSDELIKAVTDATAAVDTATASGSARDAINAVSSLAGVLDTVVGTVLNTTTSTPTGSGGGTSNATVLSVVSQASRTAVTAVVTAISTVSSTSSKITSSNDLLVTVATGALQSLSTSMAVSSSLSGGQGSNITNDSVNMLSAVTAVMKLASGVGLGKGTTSGSTTTTQLPAAVTSASLQVVATVLYAHTSAVAGNASADAQPSVASTGAPQLRSTPAAAASEAVRSSVDRSVAAITSAALRAALPGDTPMHISATPPARVTDAMAVPTEDSGGGSGHSVELTAARLAAGQPATIDSESTTSGQAAATNTVVLPANLPTGLSAGTAMDVRMVRYDVTPVTATQRTAWDRVVQTQVTTTTTHSSGTSSDGSSWSSWSSTSTSTSTSTYTSASSSSSSASRSSFTVLPSQSVTSPVVSVTVQDTAGVELPVHGLATDTPILIKMPINSTAVYHAREAISEDTSAGVDVVCPSDGEAASLSVGDHTTAGYLVAGIHRIAYVPHATLGPATDYTLDRTVTTARSWTSGVSWLPSPPSNATMTVSSGPVDGTQVELLVQCLSVQGSSTQVHVTCGPGYAGTVQHVGCPVPTQHPLCGYWDASASAWAADGCTVHATTNDSVVCACTHLTDFAARFAAVAADNRAIFSNAAILADARVLSWYPHVFIIVGAITGLLLLLCIWAAVADCIGNRRFREKLLQDEEVQFLASLARAQGRPFVLDRVLGASKPTYNRVESTDVPQSPITSVASPSAGAAAQPYNAVQAAVRKKRLSTGALSVRYMLRQLGASSSTLLPLTAPSNGSAGAAAGASAGADPTVPGPVSPSSSASPLPVSSPVPQSPSPQAISTAPVVAPAARRGSTTGRLRMAAVASIAASYDRGTMTKDTASETLKRLLSNEHGAGAEGTTGDPASGRSGGPEEPDVPATPSKTKHHDGSDPAAKGCKRCRRACTVQALLVQVWMLRLWLSHTYLSAVTRFDPRVPRVNRVLTLYALLVTNLATTAIFFSFQYYGADGLSPPSPAEIFAMALILALVQEPIQALIVTLMAWSGEAEFKWRRPALWRELARRAAAQARYARMDSRELSQAVARLGKSLPKGLRSGGIDSLLGGAGEGTPSAQSVATASGAAQGLILRKPRMASPLAGPAHSPTTLRLHTTSDSDPRTGGTHSRSASGDRAAVADAAEAGPSAVQLHTGNSGPVEDSAGPAAVGPSGAMKASPLTRDYLHEAAEKGLITSGAAARGTTASWASKRRKAGGSPLTPLSVVTVAKDGRGLGTGAQGPSLTIPSSTSSQKEAVAATDTVGAGDSAGDDAPGWIDPPPGCVRWCGRLVRACGRHPSQRAAYVIRLRARKHMKRESLAHAYTRTRKGDAVSNGEEHGVQSSVLKARADEAQTSQTQPVHEPTEQLEDPLDMAMHGEDEEQDDAQTAAEIARTLEDAIDASHATGGMLAIIADVIVAIAMGLLDSLSKAACSNRFRCHKRRVSPLERVEKKIEQMDAQLQREAAAGRAERCCFRTSAQLGCACTTRTVVAYLLVSLLLAFSLLYVGLFGLYRPKAVTEAFMLSWLTSQAISMLVLQPLLMLIILWCTCTVWPAMLPYVVWIPVLGRVFVGPQDREAMEDKSGAAAGSTALTSRLQNLTLLRAAGYASMLQPDSAVLAFGGASAVAAAVAGARAMARGQGTAHDRGAWAGLTAGVKRRLVVDLYLLDQLRAVQAHRLQQATATGGVVSRPLDAGPSLQTSKWGAIRANLAKPALRA